MSSARIVPKLFTFTGEGIESNQGRNDFKNERGIQAAINNGFISFAAQSYPGLFTVTF